MICTLDATQSVYEKGWEDEEIQLLKEVGLSFEERGKSCIVFSDNDSGYAEKDIVSMQDLLNLAKTVQSKLIVYPNGHVEVYNDYRE